MKKSFSENMAENPTPMLPTRLEGKTSGILPTIALIIAVLAAALSAYVLSVYRPAPTYDELDVNRDGKVTLTDLVQAKRIEIRIKAKLLGEPDPFAPTITVTGEWTAPEVTWAGPKEARG